MLGVYLSLDQSVIYNDNFSDVSALKLTGTIYSDVNKTTAFNLTGYTIKIKLSEENGKADYLNQTCTITSAVAGTFYLSVAESTLPTAAIYLANIELVKSGTKVSSLNRTELLVKRAP